FAADLPCVVDFPVTGEADHLVDEGPLAAPGIGDDDEHPLEEDREPEHAHDENRVHDRATTPVILEDRIHSVGGFEVVVPGFTMGSVPGKMTTVGRLTSLDGAW